jgi:GNAT superfamily N-acetyltransferase
MGPKISLWPVPVKIADQIEQVRCIFAECIEGMATSEAVKLPSATDQQVWWNSEPRKRGFLYYTPDFPSVPVAFSVLQDHGAYMTPMFGIRKAWRGYGLGKQIIRHYLQTAGKPLHGKALVSNTIINKLNSQNGWQVIREEDGVRHLYHPNDRQQEIYDEIVRYGHEL